MSIERIVTPLLLSLVVAAVMSGCSGQNNVASPGEAVSKITQRVPRVPMPQMRLPGFLGGSDEQADLATQQEALASQVNEGAAELVCTDESSLSLNDRGELALEWSPADPPAAVETVATHQRNLLAPANQTVAAHPQAIAEAQPATEIEKLPQAEPRSQVNSQPLERVATSMQMPAPPMASLPATNAHDNFIESSYPQTGAAHATPAVAEANIEHVCALDDGVSVDLPEPPRFLPPAAQPPPIKRGATTSRNQQVKLASLQSAKAQARSLEDEAMPKFVQGSDMDPSLAYGTAEAIERHMPKAAKTFYKNPMRRGEQPPVDSPEEKVAQMSPARTSKPEAIEQKSRTIDSSKNAGSPSVDPQSSSVRFVDDEVAQGGVVIRFYDEEQAGSTSETVDVHAPPQPVSKASSAHPTQYRGPEATTWTPQEKEPQAAPARAKRTERSGNSRAGQTEEATRRRGLFNLFRR